MKTILITGASSGIGAATARYFAAKGWHVIATMICLEQGKEIADLPNISSYLLDVTNTESIEKAKQEILENHPVINVIINNAGIGYRSFVEFSEDKGIDNIVSTNWLGCVKVCRAFIPVFRKQGFGHFINVTSIAGLVNLPLGSFYHATKCAVESFSECMSYELMNFGIGVSTVQFGNAPTAFQKNVVKSKNTGIDVYDLMMDKISGILIKKQSKNTNLIEEVVETLFKIANEPRVKFTRYTVGFDANAMSTLRSVLGYRLFNKIIRKQVL
ncbi:short-chain dehydrogenase [Flavobacterium columnare NBRC 100251 = ATCC 23463]|uniref:SDR family NAD(P)-dependent oxidoreductase n=1 Tax=Flavobacterium columnare TaxID=996 RepID=UPI000BE8EC6E|nr:SDR family NAD(P)-dependent oxidoreductase [Flavobacterium columnare]PDS26018.1 short-chain dehydrogenase [Flavobacterium columnare NBRC 100251 = ATCC 23463]GEM57144.1 short-chain dehydrogenase [Flavobacterium columnare NBRC 100251 = ATCC 23463]